jgi:glutamate-1-semialdehyde 2,1-aminomutase
MIPLLQYSRTSKSTFNTPILQKLFVVFYIWEYDILNRSEELFLAARRVIPGGVNSPVRAFKSVGRDPLYIKSAKGSKITDVDDRSYIDFVGSWGPMIVGHAHEEVIEAIHKTAISGTSFGAPTELETQIAQKIIEMIPSVEMVRMVNSGTEATMSAVRAARGYTKRDKIIKFDGCYHGHGDSFLIKAGSGALTLGEPDSPGIPKRTVETTLSSEFNNLQSVEFHFENSPEDIAAVIIEPIAGNMGVVPPKIDFLSGLRKLCNQYGALLIFDEVMTGFRVHPGGAQALYSIKPDLTTLGKIIGGGLPVGAYGGKREVMEMIAPNGPVYQAGTLSGNPLAMSAGLKTLEIINRPGFYGSLNEKSIGFFEKANKFISEHDLPLSLNYVNSMGCLFFEKSKVENFQQALKCDTKKFGQYFSKMLDSGIYLAPSQYEAMFISAAHTEEELEQTFNIMKRVLLEISSLE